ncbi:MAG TPA: hypothetical protein VFJ57_09845 [Solirubrobacterales bacterium]|nr:hypothetical protein [Solirubrobacterales bacterium]
MAGKVTARRVQYWGWLGVFACLALVAIISRPAGAAEQIRMQALVDVDGTGRLFINSSGGSWAWEACRADGASCKPFGHGREIEVDGAPAGTIFRVTSGTGATGMSPEWRGRLRQLKPPSVSGHIQANEFVDPMPGQWSGGWRGEYAQMQMAACATKTGEGCTTLTDLHYVRTCSLSASFALDASFTGQYLRVANRRVGGTPPIEPQFAVTSPNAGTIWPRSPTTSIATLTRIAPATSPFSGECGSPPPGIASISKEGVVSADCQGGCRAAMRASGHGNARVERVLPAHSALLVPPPTELRVPQRVFEGARNVRIVVKINGKQVAQRTVHPRG